MKLMATMVDDIIACDYDSGIEPTEQLEHDALAAHALLQAIREWWDRPSEEDSCTDAAVTWIEQRADALFQEWTKQDEVK